MNFAASPRGGRPARRLRVVLVLSAVAPLLGCGRFDPSGASDRLPVVPPPPPPPPPPVTLVEGAARFLGIGQVSPLEDGALVTWSPLLDASSAPDLDFAYDVFVSTDGSRPDFDAAPFGSTAAGESSFVIDAVAIGTPLQIGVRARNLLNPDDLDRNEVSLPAQVARIFHVDAAAGAGGDGSAGAPFDAINDAVIAAIGSGAPANIRIAGGTYTEQVALLGGQFLYGAYPSGFAGPRDRTANPTSIVSNPGTTVTVRVLPGTKFTVIDGVEVIGRSTVLNGISVRDADLSLCNSTVSGFTGEGVILSCSERTYRLDVHGCGIQSNGLEGLQAAGSFDASLTTTSFVQNGNEGCEFDDLAPQHFETARIWARDCRFSDNGDDGLDIDYNELKPLIGGSSDNGFDEVVIERCVAEDNGLWGFLVDIDFDAGDDIGAQTLILQSQSRRNGQDGILFDLDQPRPFWLIGNVTAANAGHGIAVTSLEAGLVQVENHYDLGAAFDGVHVEGAAYALLSHLGAAGAGRRSVFGNDRVHLSSGALWSAPAPAGATVDYSYLDRSFPGDGNVGGAPEFTVAPFATFFTTGPGGTDRVPLPSGIDVQVGDSLELEEDGVAHEVTSVTATEVRFSPAADSAVGQGTFVALYTTDTVADDLRLFDGSPWIDAGDPIGLDTDDSRTDIGVQGGLAATFAPSRVHGLFPFSANVLDPPPGPFLGPLGRVTIHLTTDPNASTVDTNSFRVEVGGVPVPSTVSVSGRTLTLDLTTPIASGPATVLLTQEVEDPSGVVLTLPVRYQIEVQ